MTKVVPLKKSLLQKLKNFIKKERELANQYFEKYRGDKDGKEN